MATTYEITFRFDGHDDRMAACLVHELLTRLKPTYNPRLWDASFDIDEAHRSASTDIRDEAFRFVAGITPAVADRKPATARLTCPCGDHADRRDCPY